MVDKDSNVNLKFYESELLIFVLKEMFKICKPKQNRIEVNQNQLWRDCPDEIAVNLQQINYCFRKMVELDLIVKETKHKRFTSVKINKREIYKRCGKDFLNEIS